MFFWIEATSFYKMVTHFFWLTDLWWA